MKEYVMYRWFEADMDPLNIDDVKHRNYVAVSYDD